MIMKIDNKKHQSLLNRLTTGTQVLIYFSFNRLLLALDRVRKNTNNDDNAAKAYAFVYNW